MSCDHKIFHGHHLIFREELKKDGENKVLCRWCHEPIWGSLYNCVECHYRPVHSYSSNDHFLKFTEKLENEGNKQIVCFGCDEPVLGPAYKCSFSKCSFLIHKLCTELPHKINHPFHPDHTLSLRGPAGTKRCDVCCRSHDSSYFYDCYLCGFQLDIKCANRLLINPNDCHQHEFFPFWKQIEFNCEICGEKITNLTYMVCNICKLLVHYSCAQTPHTIKITLHNHFLNLICSLLEIKEHDNMFCKICCEDVNTKYAAYLCRDCRYVAHLKCGRQFQEEWTRTSASVPSKSVGHATHLVKSLNQSKDEGPHLSEIQHFSHQHQLILCHDEFEDDKLCEGCMDIIVAVPFYSCAQCNFFLHTRCAKLPTNIEQHQLHNIEQHQLHKIDHTFTLLQRHPYSDRGVFFCEICSRKHRGFTYQCQTCYTTLDVQCGLIPETIKHDGHQHPLSLAITPKRKCKACSKESAKTTFICTYCDFALGIACANLPLLARHKYDAHLLKLTYAAEDDFGEYYCLICEEKRDPKDWFYYCETCNFPAHSQCVIGNHE